MVNVLVIGETCIDRFIYGTVNRISPEAPVPIFVPIETKENSGMSGNVVENLKATAKNSNLHIDIHDQFPLYRQDHFDGCGYNHIFWDHIYSPIKYKSQSIRNFQTEYSLVISDRIMLEDGWDEKLVSFIEGNPLSLVSGNGLSTLTFKNLFYIGRVNNFLKYV